MSPEGSSGIAHAAVATKNAVAKKARRADVRPSFRFNIRIFPRTARGRRCALIRADARNGPGPNPVCAKCRPNHTLGQGPYSPPVGFAPTIRWKKSFGCGRLPHLTRDGSGRETGAHD